MSTTEDDDLSTDWSSQPFIDQLFRDMDRVEQESQQQQQQQQKRPYDTQPPLKTNNVASPAPIHSTHRTPLEPKTQNQPLNRVLHNHYNKQDLKKTHIPIPVYPSPVLEPKQPKEPQQRFMVRSVMHPAHTVRSESNNDKDKVDEERQDEEHENEESEDDAQFTEFDVDLLSMIDDALVAADENNNPESEPAPEPAPEPEPELEAEAEPEPAPESEPEPEHKPEADNVRNEPHPRQDTALLHEFGGFMTAGSRKRVEIKDEAWQRALRLFHEPNKEESTKEEQSSSPEPERAPSPPSSLPHPSPSEPIAAITAAADNTTDDTALFGGFTTGRGGAMPSASEDALRQARKLLQLDAEDTQNNSSSSQPDINTSTNTNTNTSADSLKRPADGPTSEFKYESILSEYGGFRMGNSRMGIPVSADAKRQAIALFNSDSTSRELTQATQATTQSSSSVSSVSSRHATLNPLEPQPEQLDLDLNDRMLLLNSPEQEIAKLDESRIPSSPASSPPRPRRLRRMQGAIKPFQSPVIQSNLAQTKAAIHSNRTKQNLTKGHCVFNLTPPGPRYTLESLGLPLQHSRQDLTARGIPDAALDMSHTKAREHTFGTWGYKEARADMIAAGCLTRLLDESWVKNHFGWIVWKLASTVRSFPHLLHDIWSTREVMRQLLYRYEREINQGERSALKRIYEQDDVPVKHMVLAVADIIFDALTTPAGPGDMNKSHVRLVLTDGWYEIPASIDHRMERAISRRKIAIGSKLSICGAQLIGEREPQSPLGARGTALSISANRCLPATWYCKLGYQPRSIVLRSLSSVYNDGGLVRGIDIVVHRKYPMKYRETLTDGTTMIRTEREEYETRRQALLSQQQQQRESVEERNVSAYFRAIVADTQGQTKRSLLVSDANDILYRDIREGARYKVYFVMPFVTPRNPTELKTTRLTRWEPCAGNPVGYTPRKVMLCKDLIHGEMSSDIDVAVLVIHASTPVRIRRSRQVVWEQRLLVCDSSRQLCYIVLMIPVRALTNVQNQVIGFTNLRYDTYDSKFNVVHLRSTNDTEYISKYSEFSHVRQAIQDVGTWLSRNEDKIRETKARARDLLAPRA